MVPRTFWICVAWAYTVTGFLAPAEKEALLTFYEHTIEWDTDFGWSTPSSDPCCFKSGMRVAPGWFGISCTGTCKDTTPQHVDALDLPLNNIFGYDVGIPDAAFNLPFLRFLNLGQNYLGPNLPYLCNMTRLQFLDLSRNNWVDVVPECLLSFQHLSYVNMTYTGLGGSIAPVLCNSPNLTTLAFMRGTLVGELPDCAVSPTLTTLELSYNYMNGSLPAWITQGIEIVRLESNELSGTLPTFGVAGKIPRLLELSYNLLSGEFPSNIQAFEGVETLSLNNNFLSGSIPEAIWNLTSLRVLNIGNNLNLEGVLPSSFSNLPQLEFIDIANSALSGTLPCDEESYLTLEHIALNGGSVTGTLPPALCGNYTSLRYLEMSNNQLTGTIPDCMFKSDYFSFFRVADNSLDGSLPISITQALGLSVCDVSNNFLSGLLPAPWPMYYNSIVFLSLAGNYFHGPPPMVFDMAGGQQFVGNTAYVDISDLDMGGITMDQMLAMMTLSSGCNAEGALLLNTLFASNINVTGDFSAALFCFFPQITTLSLANNRITGTIPETAEPPLWLGNLDLSNNLLVGDIPDSFGRAIMNNLYSLNLKGNPLASRRREHALPDFLSYTWHTQVDNETAHFSCPSIVAAATRATVSLDPTYYSYVACNCSNYYYGRVTTGCQDTSLLCPAANTHNCINSTYTRANSLRNSVGFAPSPNASYVVAFLPCVGGQDAMYTAPGCTRSCECHVQDDGSITCPDDCSVCADGYQGRLCANCSVDYYSLGLACVPCGATGHTWPFLIAAGGFVLMVIVAAVRLDPVSGDAPRTCLRRWVGDLALVLLVSIVELTIAIVLSELDIVEPFQFQLILVSVGLSLLFLIVWQQMGYRHSGHADMDRDVVDKGLLKTTLVYVQTSLAIVPWAQIGDSSSPGSLFSQGVALVNLQLTALRCLAPQFQATAQLVLVLLLPLIYFIATSLVFWLRMLFIRCRGEHPDHVINVRNRVYSTMLFLFNFLFFSMVSKALDVTNCLTDITPGESNHSYLASLPYIECGTAGQWRHMAITSGVFFFFYLFVLLALMRKLCTLRDRLADREVKERYGFLYGNYKHKVWWFELVVLTRRFAIAVLIAVLPSSSPVRTEAIVAVLLVALTIQLAMHPMKTRRANILESVSLCVIIVTFTGATNLQLQTPIAYSRGSGPSLRLALIIANFIFLGILVLAVAASPIIDLITSCRDPPSTRDEVKPLLETAREWDGDEAARRRRELADRLAHLDAERKTIMDQLASGSDA